MKIAGHEIHHVAELFPLMEGEEFTALVEDIRANGLREAIWEYEGKVIDGRNRLRACEAGGVQPVFQEWDGKGSLVKFIVSLNLHRRQLSPSQLAVVAVDLLPMLEEEAKQRQREGQAKGGQTAGRGRKRSNSIGERIPQSNGRAPKSADEAAAATGANPRYVSDAKRIKAEAPELFDQVKAGKLTMPQAKRQTKPPPMKPPEVLDLIDVIRSWTERSRRWRGLMEKVVPYIDYIDEVPIVAERWRAEVQVLIETLNKFNAAS